MGKTIYERFEFSDSYKFELIEWLRAHTNTEIGGSKIFDGTRTHLMQSPWELADFIFALKEFEERTGKKLKRFLEVGFASGITNTVLHKFFDFELIVAVDYFSSNINAANLHGNMLYKNLILLCGNSRGNFVLDSVGKLGKFDLIFIDADHTYEGVRADFENFSPFLSDVGVIGFHDVNCPDWPGVRKFWEECSSGEYFRSREFVELGYKLQYGIGMLERP